MLLTDADVEHSPHNVATLAAVAEAGGYDLASFMVKLHCRSLAEKLLIPAFVFFFFMLYPPEWIRDPRFKTAGAAGGCMLIRPAALQRIGGIAAIRQEIIDDCALARAVKSSGGKVWLGVTGDTRSLRPYNSFGEIERMIARTAFNQLRHSIWLLLGCDCRYDFAVPVASWTAGEPASTTRGDWRRVLSLHDCDVFSDCSVLWVESALGDDAARERCLLYGRYNSFRG